MKKAKKAAHAMTPDQSALAGTTAKDPHGDFAKHDANFKKSRGAQK
jgi:hypothetical protein